jgi:hypothetical protein
LGFYCFLILGDNRIYWNEQYEQQVNNTPLRKNRIEKMAPTSHLFTIEVVKAMETMMDIALNRFYRTLHRVPHYNVQISFSSVHL